MKLMEFVKLIQHQFLNVKFTPHLFFVQLVIQDFILLKIKRNVVQLVHIIMVQYVHLK